MRAPWAAGFIVQRADDDTKLDDVMTAMLLMMSMIAMVKKIAMPTNMISPIRVEQSTTVVPNDGEEEENKPLGEEPAPS